MQLKFKGIVPLAVLAVTFWSYFVLTSIDSKRSIVFAQKTTHTGTLYVSGMGGHFAKADVVIDPTDSNAPIKIKNLDRLVVGVKHIHNIRIDADDRNIIFWATYRQDQNGKVHVGKFDLNTGNVIKDVSLQIDERTKKTAALYCGSGQTKNSYLAIVMGPESYVDVFDKNDLTHKHRVFLDEIGYKPGGYRFFHGSSTIDMKGLLLTTDLVEGGKTTGQSDLLMLDSQALEEGKVKVLAKNSITGDPAKTYMLRGHPTRDGKYLLRAGGDRMFVIDADTLKPIDETIVSGVNDDVLPTPDGKYAVLTLRQAVSIVGAGSSSGVIDGMLQLYDIDQKKLIGKSVSICNSCHIKSDIQHNAHFNGLEGNWK